MQAVASFYTISYKMQLAPFSRRQKPQRKVDTGVQLLPGLTFLLCRHWEQTLDNITACPQPVNERPSVSHNPVTIVQKHKLGHIVPMREREGYKRIQECLGGHRKGRTEASLTGKGLQGALKLKGT